MTDYAAPAHDEDSPASLSIPDGDETTPTAAASTTSRGPRRETPWFPRPEPDFGAVVRRQLAQRILNVVDRSIVLMRRLRDEPAWLAEPESHDDIIASLVETIDDELERVRHLAVTLVLHAGGRPSDGDTGAAC